jgi:hypothetical protein
MDSQLGRWSHAHCIRRAISIGWCWGARSEAQGSLVRPVQSENRRWCRWDCCGMCPREPSHLLYQRKIFETVERSVRHRTLTNSSKALLELSNRILQHVSNLIFQLVAIVGTGLANDCLHLGVGQDTILKRRQPSSLDLLLAFVPTTPLLVVGTYRLRQCTRLRGHSQRLKGRLRMRNHGLRSR